MKRLHWIAAIALLWAQQDLSNLQIQLRLPERLRPFTLDRIAPQYRTATLGWLLPNQNYAIVPSPTNDPNYAGDTLLSNGVGPNTRPNPPAACVGTFFDSLEVTLAYLFDSNERTKVADAIPNVALFTDGTVAERYDIAPDLGSVNRTVSIKGVAAMLYNIPSSSSSACNLSLPTPVPDSMSDGDYTFFYAIYPVRPYQWGSPFYSTPRQGTLPGSTPLRMTGKPASSIRVINAIEMSTGPQCPLPGGNPPSIIELFDFVYFSQPLDITDSTSYYVVAGTERYNLNTYNLTDTVYFFLGPAYSGAPQNNPCFTGDTALIGRTLIAVGLYDTTSSGGDYYGPLSGLSPTLPDWIPTHAFGGWVKNGLNAIVFPIVYAQEITSGIWLNSGMQRVMTPYPNPTTECFYIQFEVPQSTQVRAYLYTTDGRLVKVWNPQPIPAGEAKVALDVQDVPAGTYLLRTETDFGRSAFQVTVLH